MEITINVKEARERFSQLLDRAEHGEEVLITRRGREIAKIVGVAPTQTKEALSERRATLRASLPKAKESAVEIVRSMREERV